MTIFFTQTLLNFRANIFFFKLLRIFSAWSTKGLCAIYRYFFICAKPEVFLRKKRNRTILSEMNFANDFFSRKNVAQRKQKFALAFAKVLQMETLVRTLFAKQCLPDNWNSGEFKCTYLNFVKKITWKSN